MAWFLESIAADGLHVSQTLDTFPFRVGRGTDNDLVVVARGLSRLHAVIDVGAGDRLQVTDLGSTNGTFVNHQRIDGARVLAEDDVIHFGHAEFRLGMQAEVGDIHAADSERTVISVEGRSLSEHFVRHERQFRELLGGRGMSAAAQPIVDAHNGSLFAYELLGRCTHPELPASPIHLFRLAALLKLETELSEAFRSHGVVAIASRLRGARLFVNTHPKETFSEELFRSLSVLCAMPGAPRLVVEVHEAAVVEVLRMREFAARLDDIGATFAYDDFGAGQARLNELADVPAPFIKFDMGLVRGIHEAGERKQRVVRNLVRLVLDLGSVPLAEGVELEAEAEVCREMGFQLIQGYLTGRPGPLDSI